MVKRFVKSNKLEMSNTSVNGTVVSPTSVPCVLDGAIYLYLLIPAVIILTILAFLRKRTSFKKDVWDGRPGLVVPIDFIGNDHNRLAIMCVFGAATSSIFYLIIVKYLITGASNEWEKAFVAIALAIVVAFLYYPYFGCLASHHRIIGALMGLSYAVLSFSLSMFVVFQKCNIADHGMWGHVGILTVIPKTVCELFIMGKFVLVLYKEIKKIKAKIKANRKRELQLFSRDDKPVHEEMKLVRSWLLDYVKNLVNSKRARQYSGPARKYSKVEFYLRKIYNPERNFKFSTQTVSVFMVCCILLYMIYVPFVFVCSFYLDKVRKSSENGKMSEYRAGDLRGFWGSLLAATLLTTIFHMVSLIRFMENHKNNMLRMFKGDKSFIPKRFRASQFMIGESLKYPSFQIVYFLWGYILLLLLFFVICFALYAFISIKIVRDSGLNFIKGISAVLVVAIFSFLLLKLVSYTVFRDYTYSKDVISLNNRNVYMVFSYFWFFVGLPMGLFSVISRILRATFVGALMLSRVDRSLMPKGFQQFDPGFNAYTCFLHVQTAFRNPILRVFCQILCDEKQKDHAERKWRRSAQARVRWFLALTLTRNPQLVPDRKRSVSTCKDFSLQKEILLFARKNARKWN